MGRKVFYRIAVIFQSLIIIIALVTSADIEEIFRCRKGFGRDDFRQLVVIYIVAFTGGGSDDFSAGPDCRKVKAWLVFNYLLTVRCISGQHSFPGK